MAGAWSIYVNFDDGADAAEIRFTVEAEQEDVHMRPAASARAAIAASSLVLGTAACTPAQDPGEWKTDFSRHVVPLAEIVSGGPPKDGIPAIDAPRFTSVGAADRWIEDNEPVMVIEHGGAVRIYPIQIVIWHEIVNDRIGDLPVAVTFCPLCNTALAFVLTAEIRTQATTARRRRSPGSSTARRISGCPRWSASWPFAWAILRPPTRSMRCEALAS